MEMKSEAEVFHQRPNPVVGGIVPTPVGSMNYNVLRALIEEGQVLRLGHGAEIGVFEASTSEHLLKSFPNLVLHCVDPFIEYTEHEGDKTSSKMSECEQIARTKLVPFGERAHIIKDFSVEASKQFADESLDFVFIDAIHTYEAVSEDLKAWFPKVRPGGLISGHDYSWSGIKEAVQDFIAPIGKAAYHSPSTSDVWFFVK